MAYLTVIERVEMMIQELEIETPGCVGDCVETEVQWPEVGFVDGFLTTVALEHLGEDKRLRVALTTGNRRRKGKRMD